MYAFADTDTNTSISRDQRTISVSASELTVSKHSNNNNNTHISILSHVRNFTTGGDSCYMHVIFIYSAGFITRHLISFCGFRLAS